MPERNFSSFCLGIVLSGFALVLCNVGFVLCSIYVSIVSVFFIGRGIFLSNKQLFSMTLIFLVFSGIYGLIAPLYYLKGLLVESIFPLSSLAYVDAFLNAFYLSCLGFGFGCLFLYRKNETAVFCFDGSFFLNNKVIIFECLISSFLASLFEFINLFRAGGFQSLLLGKAFYQSVMSNLTLTLPSDVFFCINGLFLGLLIALHRINCINHFFKILLLNTILLVPFLFVEIILGMRSVLIVALLSGMASYSFLKPLKKVSLKLLIALLLVYSFFDFVYNARGYVLYLFENPKLFMEKVTEEYDDEERNIANGEFGSPFGNFCLYYEKYKNDVSYKYGSTYLKGLVVPIPRFLYPTDKPVQISYEFRNEFFSSLKNNGEIAGTAYSSLLEAFVNWGWLGIFISYFCYAIFLGVLDIKRNSTRNENFLYFYSVLVYPCLAFSRSSFGVFWGTLVVNSILVVVFTSVCKFFVEKRSR